MSWTVGDLVCLDEWRKAKEEAVYSEKMEEIDSLRAELSELMDEMVEVEPEMYVAEEADTEAWHRRMVAMMLHTLDGYRNWPIDSSDM